MAPRAQGTRRTEATNADSSDALRDTLLNWFNTKAKQRTARRYLQGFSDRQLRDLGLTQKEVEAAVPDLFAKSRQPNSMRKLSSAGGANPQTAS